MGKYFEIQFYYDMKNKKTGEFFPKFDYRWNLRAYWIKEEGNCTLSKGEISNIAINFMSNSKIE